MMISQAWPYGMDEVCHWICTSIMLIAVDIGHHSHSWLKSIRDGSLELE